MHCLYFPVAIVNFVGAPRGRLEDRCGLHVREIWK